jgi:hypothetical protein
MQQSGQGSWEILRGVHRDDDRATLLLRRSRYRTV